MNTVDFVQIILFFTVLFTFAPLLGRYMRLVYSGTPFFARKAFGAIESVVYRLTGTDAKAEMNAKSYLAALLIMNAVGFVILFCILYFQQHLPFNQLSAIDPKAVTQMTMGLAFNTAVSFVTNTNWQAYSGEVTLTYGAQMAGLTVQNFVSAATGMAAMVALIRGFTQKNTDKIGNAWVDVTRSVVYILLPLSAIVAILLAGQGVVQTLGNYVTVTGIEGAEQVIPLGPGASQIAIKQLGTNGGGFFGVNSAYPLENPTPFSNLIQMLSLLLLPISLLFTFGEMIRSKKQAWAILGAMLILFAIGLIIAFYSEFSSNPILAGDNMEGKEQRFGVMNSVLWAVSTTATSNGSVNAMHDSLQPLAGMIPLFNMMLGEVVFGGVGCGLYGMLFFVILTVFLAGLMVGRTPEYLGKKLEAKEIKWAMLGILAPGASILFFAALAAVTKSGLATLNNAGPHGLSEILYAFSSASGNNGSAFAGLGVNNDFYNYLLGFAMLIGRYACLIPAVVIAGSLSAKKITPLSSGTFRTDTGLFVALLISVIIIAGALTFLPALSLGPIVEQILLYSGRTF